MAVFSFICKNSGGTWTAKQRNGDMESSASDHLELQKQVRNLALESAGSGAVSIDFSLVTPSSAVLLVTVGGLSSGGFSSGGASSAAAATPAAAAAPAAVEENKKEEEKEESDDDMGFALFD